MCHRFLAPKAYSCRSVYCEVRVMQHLPFLPERTIPYGGSSSAEDNDNPGPSGAGLESPSRSPDTEESLCSPGAGLTAATTDVAGRERPSAALDCPNASLSGADLDNEYESGMMP
ncbi:hypothetical protein XPA_003399 [Xanthoria parietina]